MFDFDQPIDRYGTQSIKFDSAAERGKPADAFPLWVADMDFSAPPCVAEALEQRVAHGVYGYSDTDGAYDSALTSWFAVRHGWRVEPRWNCVTPGVVPALFFAVRGLTEPGDGVLLQTPVYYPFFAAVREQGRALLENGLVLRDGRYEIDFDDFERKAKQAKLFLLCSPHNPVGRVWTRDELARMGEICLAHGVTVVSDEIHADFVFPGHTHTVFASLSENFAQMTVTCTSPSKTFNLAGLLHANVLIKNEALRGKFKATHAQTGLSQGSLMGMIACKAAYENGQPWLAALLAYLEGNLALAGDMLSRNPKIKIIPPEGTYLLWLDCRAMGLAPAALDGYFLRDAKLWLDAGTMFGPGGEGFARLNMALPRAKLRECLERLG
jgi:cystathionine beta-lyase